MSSKKEKVDIVHLKDVKHVSEEERGKSCVSNCMEKVLFQVMKM